MRAWYRAIVIFLVVVSFTLRTSAAVRRLAAHRRVAFRVRRQMTCARKVCRILGISVTATGQIPEHRAMLCVSNHLTALDPVLIGSQMPVCFAGKASIASWPVLGWVCRTYGMLLVDRSRPSATQRLIEEINDRIESGVSMLVFPEGTTNWGLEVNTFKTGVFEAVAGRSGAAVLPMFMDVTAIDGSPCDGASGRHRLSHNHRPTLLWHLFHTFGYRSINVILRVGHPVESGNLDRKQLARKAHDAVSAMAQALVL